MFSYDKFLQRPINIKNKNPQLANIIITQNLVNFNKKFYLFDEKIIIIK